jgi:hypothetical protein
MRRWPRVPSWLGRWASPSRRHHSRPRRLLPLNLLLALLGCTLALGLIRESLAWRPLPPPPTPRIGPSAEVAAVTAPPTESGTYAVIAAKNLFSPGRSEAPVGPITTATNPKPVLHGVVIDGAKSRAYLEDSQLKQTFGYGVGDPIGGGRLESIGADRVFIARADGSVEVLLKDPSKPKPAEPATAPSGAPPASAAAPAPSGVAVPARASVLPAAGAAALPSRLPPAIGPRLRGNDR